MIPKDLCKTRFPGSDEAVHEIREAELRKLRGAEQAILGRNPFGYLLLWVSFLAMDHSNRANIGMISRVNFSCRLCSGEIIVPYCKYAKNPFTAPRTAPLQNCCEFATGSMHSVNT